jgi:hypothetical protein
VGTPEYDRWTALTVRRPDDVRTEAGGPIPLRWQMEKLTEHGDRLRNNLLADDFPHEVERGDAGDALSSLALGEALRRDLARERVWRIRAAIELGATWDQVATALDTSADQARAELRNWANDQRELWVELEAEGKKPFGLDLDEFTAVLALCSTPSGGEQK